MESPFFHGYHISALVTQKVHTWIDQAKRSSTCFDVWSSFLQIYGSTATKEDAIEVFKDWNISGDSAFSGQTEQPPSFASFLNTIKDKVKVTGSDKETD